MIERFRRRGDVALRDLARELGVDRLAHRFQLQLAGKRRKAGQQRHVRHGPADMLEAEIDRWQRAQAISREVADVVLEPNSSNVFLVLIRMNPSFFNPANTSICRSSVGSWMIRHPDS
jgi:hypothetical protein